MRHPAEKTGRGSCPAAPGNCNPCAEQAFAALFWPARRLPRTRVSRCRSAAGARPCVRVQKYVAGPAPRPCSAGDIPRGLGHRRLWRKEDEECGYNYRMEEVDDKHGCREDGSEIRAVFGLFGSSRRNTKQAAGPPIIPRKIGMRNHRPLLGLCECIDPGRCSCVWVLRYAGSDVD